MLLPVIYKPGTLMVFVLVLCLPGCKKDFDLLNESGQTVGKGVLEITANFPSPAHLMLDGKEYEGVWRVTKVYEASLAKSRRLLSNRAYTTYIIGNDPAQLKHGHASLSAGDGSKVECNFDYRGEPKSGSCDIDGKQLKLTVRQG